MHLGKREKRRQQEASLVTADPATGRTKAILAERDAAWINLFKANPDWLDLYDRING